MLALALLFCHGVFGYEHQLAESAYQLKKPAMQHGQHHGTTTDQGAHFGHPAEGGYFATLLVLLLGTLLLRGMIQAGLSPPAPKLSKEYPRRPVFHPPRGPTAPVLQVFRL